MIKFDLDFQPNLTELLSIYQLFLVYFQSKSASHHQLLQNFNSPFISAFLYCAYVPTENIINFIFIFAI